MGRWADGQMGEEGWGEKDEAKPRCTASEYLRHGYRYALSSMTCYFKPSSTLTYYSSHCVNTYISGGPPSWPPSMTAHPFPLLVAYHTAVWGEGWVRDG